jgi:tetratricopeptide (TPR) repeat protein
VASVSNRSPHAVRPPRPARTRRGTACAIALLLAAGCSSKAKRPDIAWKAAPAGQPGSLARSGDQAEPRLEGLPEPTPTPPPSSELNRAASLSANADILRDKGDLPGAIADEQQALAIRERVLGPGHLDVASTLTSLAELYAVNDEYVAAEPLLQRALSIREQALGPKQPQVAESLSNLALLYAAQGRYKDAEPLYQRAIRILEGADGEHPEAMAVVLENYAALLADSGRPEGARALEARAAALRTSPTPRPSPVP